MIQPLPFRMKPMHDALLRGTDRTPTGLYHLYKATAEQLTRLHYSAGSLKAVKARLKTLAREGYVQHSSVAVQHETPRRMFFSARYFYTLAAPGVRYLAGLGYDVDEAWRPHHEADPHGLFVAHTLELNDVLIAAVLLKGADPRFSLKGFTHERVLKHRPYPVTLEGGRGTSVIPDAYLDFRQAGTTVHFPVLLEHDRGTEERAHFKRKIQAYVAFIAARGYATAFGSDRINVAFTTFRGDDRLQEMRQWTKHVLDGQPDQVARAFRFARLPRPPSSREAWLEPRWFYSYDAPPEPLLAA